MQLTGDDNGDKLGAEDYLRLLWDIMKLIMALSVSLAAYQAVRQAWHLLKNMKIAMDVERPTRTRGDLEELPVIGNAFSVACDATDCVSFNSQLIGKYVGTIPVLFAVPTIFGTLSSLWSMKRSASAVVLTATAFLSRQ